jgi:ATP-binding cassette subfamily F protein uup
MEREQGEIDALLADGLLYGTEPDRAALLAKRHAELDDELLQALERWEALSPPSPG